MHKLGTYKNKYDEKIVDVLSIATNTVDNGVVVVFHISGNFSQWYTMPIKRFNETFVEIESKKLKRINRYIESFA